MKHLNALSEFAVQRDFKHKQQCTLLSLKSLSFTNYISKVN